jgi:hypothetical protein
MEKIPNFPAYVVIVPNFIRGVPQKYVPVLAWYNRFSLHQIVPDTIPEFNQVPILLASSFWQGLREAYSYRCLEMGEGNLGTQYPFSPRKIAQILEKCTIMYVTLWYI